MKNQIEQTSPSINLLSDKIDSIPRINEDELNNVINRINNIIGKIEQSHNKQEHFPIETCWKHGLMGIHGIWFSKSEDWSLGFLESSRDKIPRANDSKALVAAAAREAS